MTRQDQGVQNLQRQNPQPQNPQAMGGPSFNPGFSGKSPGDIDTDMEDEAKAKQMEKRREQAGKKPDGDRNQM